MDERLERLRAAIAAATSIEAGPPATSADVAAFEAAYGIVIPDEARRFLLEVADGLRLDGEPMLYGLADLRVAQPRSAVPARPFPYGDADADAIRAAINAAGPAGPLADPRVMGLQRAGDPDGCLILTCNGGNDFSALVVTGAQRGVMWRTGELDAPECRELYTAGGGDAPLGFLDWIGPWASCFLGVDLDAG
ncbi:MAG: SMI1/KNR4 family protein [Myxococcales bacterium]|nr:SMI1/KNR4 family protein [Myxococcales bacterium]MBK7191394.1 SMI1/KNR4 family protein [Myxococcales bacterium]MBP6844709.1 SMI1/KNR4 family protein [Kofleriaceae bacterium]